MSKVTINGVTIETDGMSSISVLGNGEVKINGKIIDIGNHGGNIKVTVEGDLAKLDASGSVTVNGNVLGDVDCGGSFHGDNVGGNVDCGGSCTCGQVGGDVDAGGSVSMRR